MTSPYVRPEAPELSPSVDLALPGPIVGEVLVCDLCWTPRPSERFSMAGSPDAFLCATCARLVYGREWDRLVVRVARCAPPEVAGGVGAAAYVAGFSLAVQVTP